MAGVACPDASLLSLVAEPCVQAMCAEHRVAFSENGGRPRNLLALVPWLAGLMATNDGAARCSIDEAGDSAAWVA